MQQSRPRRKDRLLKEVPGKESIRNGVEGRITRQELMDEFITVLSSVRSRTYPYKAEAEDKLGQL
ncbi:MAG: hypothetical protein QW292_10885 [Candidatus Parvarchaeota archaeon]